MERNNDPADGRLMQAAPDLAAENKRLREALEAAKWELQGHLEKGTAMPIINRALAGDIRNAECPKCGTRFNGNHPDWPRCPGCGTRFTLDGGE